MWQYGYSWPTNLSQITTTVTDPAGNDTRHTFSSMHNTSYGFIFRETKTQFFKVWPNSGGVLKTNQRDYKIVVQQSRHRV